MSPLCVRLPLTGVFSPVLVEPATAVTGLIVTFMVPVVVPASDPVVLALTVRAKEATDGSDTVIVRPLSCASVRVKIPPLSVP